MTKPEIHIGFLHGGVVLPHITFGVDKNLEDALKQAKILTQNLPSTQKGHTFVEKTGEPATKSIHCLFCDNRVHKQHDSLFLA